MPHLQKLYDRIKDRTDIQIVTWNVDDNVGAIDPFLKENKYTFPVLPAQYLMDQLVPSLGIPLNWIVDESGLVVSERVGFGGDGEQWVNDTLAELEKARKKK